MSGYPEELVRRRRLFDGTEITVRPIRAEDAPLEAEFVRHLSDESRYARFMTTLKELSPAKLKYLTDVDYERHLALVATVAGDGGETEVGVARYIVVPGEMSCEFAIAVDDTFQGTGLAGILMASLMETARARGLKTMEGFVLATNRRMLKFARQLGFTLHRSQDDPGTYHVVREL